MEEKEKGKGIDPVRDFGEGHRFKKGNKASVGHNRKIVKIANNFKQLCAKELTERKYRNLINKLYKLAIDEDKTIACKAIDIILKYTMPKPVIEQDITLNAGLTKDEQAQIIAENIRKQME